MNSSQYINQTSGNTEYYTPVEIVEAVRYTLEEIDLDVASTEKANQIVKAKHYFTKQDNGLDQEWFGKVWMNHPFGEKELRCKQQCKKKRCTKRGYCIHKDTPGNKDWINKFVDSYEKGTVQEAICITYASTSERWFKPLLNYTQCYIWGRTNYLDTSLMPIKGVTKGSVVTYLGTRQYAFAENFSHLGSVMIPYSSGVLTTFS